MKMTHTPGVPEGNQPAETLTKVLKDSEHVHGIVKESADELASVNSVPSEELSNQNHLPEVAAALERSEAVEDKVQDASENPTLVNHALKKEIKERKFMEQELVKVVDQQKQALHASLHDALTGLPSRLLFHDRLAPGMEQVKRPSWSLAVMFLDAGDNPSP